MRRIKIVQIGVGHDHASAIWDCLLNMPDIFDFAAFAVPDVEKEKFPERIAELSKKMPFLSIDEALSLPGLDAAAIETEEVALTDCALAAAEKGLHIHMDKPGGLELAAFEKLIDILKAKKLVFSTGYMYRFNPLISEAIARAKSGELGEIYSVEAHMDCVHPPEKRQWLDRFPGGMMFYLGCHLIDLIYQIQGEPDEIIPMNTSTEYKIDGAEDFGMAVLKYTHGVSFAKTCAAEPGGFMRRQLVICGTKGTLELRPLEAYLPDNKKSGRRDLCTVMRSAANPKNSYDWKFDGTREKCICSRRNMRRKRKSIQLRLRA